MTPPLRNVLSAVSAATLLGLAAPLSAATLVGPSGAPAELAASVRQDKRAEFQKKFEQALKINSKSQFEKLFREYPQQTVEYIISTAEKIATAPNDGLYKRMNALRGTWKKVNRTDFCENMETYFSLLDGPAKRERSKLKTDYQKLSVRFIDTTQKGGKDNKALGALGMEFKTVAERLTKVGDKYYASQAWFFAGNCFEEGFRGKDADLTKAEEYFRYGCEMSKSIGLEDRVYKETKARLDTLQGLGFGPQPEADPLPPGAEGADPDAPPIPTAPVVAAMGFEPLPKFDAIQRPNYFLDAHYPVWGSIYLKGEGSTAQVGRLGDGPIKAIRTGPAKVGLDEDGDGTADVDIPLRGSYTLVEANIGSGEEARKTAFLAVVGNDTDVYQSTEVNLSPQGESMSIYVAPAGSVVGDINGTPVRVIDEDMNGVYGNAPQSWGHIGLVDGQYQPELDSMVVGKSKRAQPWSEYVQIEGVWYQLEPQAGGSKLKATPKPVRTGFLKLGGKGLKADYLIVQGTNDYANTFFDLAGSKGKAVEVPIGVYKMYYGLVSKGKKRQRMKALILPGSSTGSYQVSAGKTVDVTIGSPYGFDFDFDHSGDQLTVKGQSVVITGAGGERYERPYGCVSRPEVSYRKSGSKRGSKGEKMPILLSQDDIYSTEKHLGFRAAWFPYDLVLTTKKADEGVEVQLVDKKNKLFGKVQSDWKE